MGKETICLRKKSFVELSIEFGDFSDTLKKNSALCVFPLLFHLSVSFVLVVCEWPALAFCVQ